MHRNDIAPPGCRPIPTTKRTVINHNKMSKTKVEGCESAGCYNSGNIEYDISMDLTKRIADTSAFCKQSITTICTIAPCLEPNSMMCATNSEFVMS